MEERSNLDYLKQIGYINKLGDVSEKYSFSSEEINWQKDSKEVELQESLLKKLLGRKKFKEFYLKSKITLEMIARFHELRPDFISGDFTRHVYLIFLKDEVTRRLEDYKL